MEWFCSKGIPLDYAIRSLIARSGNDGRQRGAMDHAVIIEGVEAEENAKKGEEYAEPVGEKYI